MSSLRPYHNQNHYVLVDSATIIIKLLSSIEQDGPTTFPKPSRQGMYHKLGTAVAAT